VAEGGIVRPSAVAEGIYRREILPWGLLGLALGLVEGATAAVLVKQHFAGVAPRFVVNLAVGLVSGAPAFANVLSFVWANLAHGLLMAAQVFTDVDRYWSKFLTDIPFVLILSLGIFLWRPRTKADELARS